MDKEEKNIANAYNSGAKQYLFSRTENKGIIGFHNREIEQPIMFELVPENLEGLILLDIGCGPGIHLKKYLERGAECHGIDISEEFIKLAGKRCPKANLKTGSVYKLEFENNTFDIITSSLVYTDVEDLNSAFNEVDRVLKKGGLFIFSMTHPLGYVFRDHKKGFVPTNSYFDKTIIYRNLSNIGKHFPDYPRTIGDLMRFFLDNNFILQDFRENEPKKSWKKEYPELSNLFYKIPSVILFKWKKGENCFSEI